MTYEKTKVKIVTKDWGKETWMANNELYCGKKLYVDQGWRCSIHHHKNKDETFYLDYGLLLLEIDDDKFLMEKGQAFRLWPNTEHRFGALEDSLIIESSTFHEDSDSYRTEVGGRIPEKIMSKYFELKKSGEVHRLPSFVDLWE